MGKTAGPVGIKSIRLACWTALPLLLAARPAAAQEAASPVTATEPTAPEDVVDFSSDLLNYDDKSEIVTAEGAVRMSRDGYYLAADRVRWNRVTGKVYADGNVVIFSPAGDKLLGDKVELTDTLRDGVIENLLITLDTGGRIAARRGVRVDGKTTLEDAVYTPCPMTTEAGCPRDPSWYISARNVVQDPEKARISFRGGRLNILGIDLPLLPVFSIGDGSQKGGITGALMPNLNLSSRNGLEVALPYYVRLSSSRDLTITPHLYTGNVPAVEARYRSLNQLGAFQLGGFLTYGKIDRTVFETDRVRLEQTERKAIRAYGEANGRFQLTPEWRLTASLRAATDKTVTRRYDLTNDDRLRNRVALERLSPNSYISLAGWAFQGLRIDDVQKSIPIALPALDARWRLEDVGFDGGALKLQANSLAILRIDGQDSQRAFASAQYDIRRLTPMGQEIVLTALGRADLYHTSGTGETAVVIYRGEEGWNHRFIGALAADVRWPLVGGFLGGVQRVVPRVQLAYSPQTKNLAIPNEDSRAVDLEDSNLFALNRFPGYDRWEDGARLTYGLDYGLDRPNWSVDANIGQSYRLNRQPSLFPDGTGLTDRLSDIVGRTRVRFGRFIDITHRYRIDKDSFAFRRNEIDLTVGTTNTYATLGYLKLDRNISSTVEDLRDKEELRVAGRVKFAKYWSAFASTVLDLTDEAEDPLSLADGFAPARHRASINYEDDCLELGLSWKRDYERIGDFRKGSTFSFHIGLKGLGR